VSIDGACTADPADPTTPSDPTSARPASRRRRGPAAASAAVASRWRRLVPAAPDDDADRPPAGRRWTPRRVLSLLVVAALVVAAVRLLLVQAFVIPSDSMQPLLHVDDRVLVSRLDYRLGDVHRGDVIVFDGAGVFDAPGTPSRSSLAAAGRAVASAFGAPVGEHDYVKRVIGLPGERVRCCDASGRLEIDGVPLDEPYLHGTPASALTFDIRVPAGRYWVMGDHRDDSGDSRAHLGDPGGGTVPEDHIVGRVVAVWWPFSRATGIGRVETSAREAREGSP